MRLKKRNKRSRARGNRTLGWAMKKHKGSGNRGGCGMAGTGKRADQRKTWVIKYQFPYFGKQGMTSRSTKHKINLIMNVGQIAEKYKSGDVDLSKYKILGEGEISEKYTVKAKSFSALAKEKIEKAGGKAVLAKEKKEKLEKPVKVEEKKEVKKKK